MTQLQALRYVTKRNGQKQDADKTKIRNQAYWCCKGLPVDPNVLLNTVDTILVDGVSTITINRQLTVNAASLISPEEPHWTFVAARFVLQDIMKVASNGTLTYPHLKVYFKQAQRSGILTDKPEDLQGFDFDALNAALVPDRDFLFDYLGMQTLADRYLIRDPRKNDKIIELPQHFWMRIAVGLSLAERPVDRTKAAISFYEELSNLRYLTSSPTLFNAFTVRPQLSSCFGSMMYDDLDSIMDVLKENANYSKFSGGTSTSMSSLRASGAFIKSTRGKAKGPIPYAVMWNAMLNGFDQGGKRKGVGAIYLEPWHPNIVEFLKLRDPGGSFTNRTHDSFPAMWIPDLFMERMLADEEWSLISPDLEPRLTETHGKAFEELYLACERDGRVTSTISAKKLWHDILTKIFQQGTFWPCFKDEINHRYMMQDLGMVHHSNLCTEITLRNDRDVSFVCNLSSVNLARLKIQRHENGQIKWTPELDNTIRTAIRGLDNVVTSGYIPHEKGRKFQDQDRAIGLGIMGWQDALYALGIPYESEEHVKFSNEMLKIITVIGIDESANLAMERGSFKTFEHSEWAKGHLPIDTIRKDYVIRKYNLNVYDVDAPFIDNDLNKLREKVKNGMRNSLLFAIAPTATISNIAGCGQCTEMPWEVVSKKDNLSGSFQYVPSIHWNNPFNMEIKASRDLDHRWTVRAAAARQLWLDQAQSTNININPNKMNAKESGDYLDDIYVEGYDLGNKTFYYCYNQAPENTDSLTDKAQKDVAPPTDTQTVGLPLADSAAEMDGPACFLRPGDPGFADCEACQ